jgi:hypothetical protein
MRHLGPDPWKGGAITDVDGRYRLGGLAAGSYHVQVYGVGRPAATSVPATVEPAKETNLDLVVPKARCLEFELAGEVPANCLGTITWYERHVATEPADGVMLEALLPPPPTVPVAGSRTRKLGPIGNGGFQATLLLPTRDRLGSCLAIELGDVADAGTKLDLPDLRQCYADRELRVESTLRVAALPEQLPLRRNMVPRYYDSASA